MDAADRYAGMVGAYEAQRARDLAGKPEPDRWTGELARRFRADPHRQLDVTLEFVAALLQPDDVFIDVGGGAGRVALPLALRCREAIVVDPSAGMQAEFDAVVAESGITNARYVRKDWLDAEGIEGDIAFAAHVTYFVRDIRRFVERMHAAARRRAIILVNSVPPPWMNASLYRLLRGEEQAKVPGHEALLSVMWDMSLLPEIRVLPSVLPASPQHFRDRAAAVQGAVGMMDLQGNATASAAVEQHFDELFAWNGEEFLPSWRPPTKTVIITWETSER